MLNPNTYSGFLETKPSLEVVKHIKIHTPIIKLSTDDDQTSVFENEKWQIANTIIQYAEYSVLGPVTPLQILPTNWPDDLYTVQNNYFKFAAKLAFSISPTSSAQPTHQLA